jgi:hypothetical protein
MSPLAIIRGREPALIAALFHDKVPGSSAREKDIAFTSGQIAGYFGDLQTCIVFNGNGPPFA